MTRLLSLALAVVVFTSCEKNPVSEPVMQYTNLGNAEVKYQSSKSIDVDGDNKSDFFFELLPVGDALGERERMQFYAVSKPHSNLLNDENDQSPMLSKGATISLQHAGYTWWNISAIVLTEKITPNGGTPFWVGDFQAASHHYLPIQVKRAEQLYNGWIEISFDKGAEKLILHKAALSTIARQSVEAGN